MMNATEEQEKRIRGMLFSSVFPHYVAKIIKKGRSLDELYAVLFWLTGFSQQDLEHLIQTKANFESFFDQADLNPKAFQLKGTICGYRIQDIEWPYTRKVRILDKLIDDLAKGKPLEKILI